jgi:Tol biopolymer transport system component
MEIRDQEIPGDKAPAPAQPDSGTIKAELARVLASRQFQGSARLRKFLALAVERTLVGDTDQLKEYRIGLEVFGRSAHFDPRLDPIVRVEARRLRNRLARFYESEGTPNGVRIAIPKGTYSAAFLADEELQASAAIEEDSDSHPLLETFKEPSRAPTKWLQFTIAGAILLAVGLLAFALLAKRARPFEAISIQKITRAGDSTMAAISPDGRLLLRVISNEGMESLRVSALAGGDDREVIPSESVRYMGVQFSHDSNFIYFVRTEASNWGLGYVYRVPAQGGKPEKLVTDIDSDISFSPDGKSFTYVVYDNPDDHYRVMIAAAAGGASKELSSGPLNSAVFDPAWSPDGKTIVCSTRQTGAHASLVAIDVATGKSNLFFKSVYARLRRPIWLPGGKELAVVATERRSPYSEQQIILVSYPSATLRPLTRDTNSYSYQSLGADGRTMVAIQAQPHWNVFLLRADSLREPNARQIALGTSVQSMAWTRDNKLLISQEAGLSLLDPGSGKQTMVAGGERPLAEQASACPDNRIVFARTASDGKQSIWRMDANGANGKQLSTGWYDRYPICSGDNKTVYYEDFAENRNFRAVPLDAGSAHPVDDRSMASCEVCGRSFDISPDGTRAVFPVWIGQTKKIVLVQLDAQAGSRLFEFRERPDHPFLRFTPEGDGIAYAIRKLGVDNIWFQSFNERKWTQLTDFSGEQIRDFQFSPDGTQLAVTRGNVESDVVMIRDTR